MAGAAAALIGRGPALAIGAAFLAFAASAVVAPLAAYTVSLALFGAPHVLSELRFVDRRFGRSLGAPLAAWIGGLLALIALARSLLVLHVVPSGIEVPVELALVALLAIGVARGPPAQRTLAVAAAVSIGAGAALAPFDTAVVFSVLHNLTPLGFLWQLTPPCRRARVMAPAAAALLGLPLLVAAGPPRAVAVALDGLDPLGAGPLGAHLYVYVPPALAGSDRAAAFFTAAVVAQGGHYLAVIVVLPLMLARLSPGAKSLLPWPPAWAFAVLVAATGLIGLATFPQDFAAARGVYGILASVHAWLEIPILVLALTGQRVSASPTASEAALAATDTSIAR